MLRLGGAHLGGYGEELGREGCVEFCKYFIMYRSLGVYGVLGFVGFVGLGESLAAILTLGHGDLRELWQCMCGADLVAPGPLTLNRKPLARMTCGFWGLACRPRLTRPQSVDTRKPLTQASAHW